LVIDAPFTLAKLLGESPKTRRITLCPYCDAIYVELAQRTGGVLATFDAAMMRAASALGIAS